jgi:hypothetical protein
MISVLDTNATLNSDGSSESNLSDDSDYSPMNHKRNTFIFDTDTIMRGSAIREDENLDESLKARFLARLFREYRRTLENAKRQQRREYRHKEIEDNIQRRFPELSPNQSLVHIIEDRKYIGGGNGEDEDRSSGFYAPKIVSSESTLGPNGAR